MKLLGLIKTCLNKKCIKVCIGKHLSDSFRIQNGVKQDNSSPLPINFALDYAIRKVQKTQRGLKRNGTHQLLAYAYDANLPDTTIKNLLESTIKKNI
jgi:hypothetical protein